MAIVRDGNGGWRSYESQDKNFDFVDSKITMTDINMVLEDLKQSESDVQMLVPGTEQVMSPYQDLYNQLEKHIKPIIQKLDNPEFKGLYELLKTKAKLELEDLK